MVLHERIKARRKQLNISQEKLARDAGYSDKSSISKIEKGLAAVPMDRLVALCIALKTSMGYLLGMTDDPEDESMPNADYYLEIQRMNLQGDVDSMVLQLALFIEKYRKCSKEEACKTAGIIAGYSIRADVPELLMRYYESDPSLQQAVLTILRSGAK